LLKPDEITAESFRIIDAEVGEHGFDPVEWSVVQRIIHAAGDVDLVHAVHFHRHAARAGVRALQQGVPLVTDVRMVAAGVRQQALTDLGLALHCFIDAPDVARQAQATGHTRSFCAMQKAMDEVGPAVYVIGNAPTALLALCDRVRQGLVRPRLVVAMPVGFVSVVESKEQALTLDVPVITVHGRKGGSAVATATVNALLILAQQDTLS
jgi:precorrin-8X/cobalt-precorrin-8 methylmutase